MASGERYGFQTRAAHLWLDGKKENRPLSIPIHQGVNWETRNTKELGELFKSQAPTFYTRFGHPTLRVAGEKIAELEGAEAGLVFSSGMGAITTSLLAVLQAGDHVVAQRNIFAQTFLFFDAMARELGVETTFVDACDPDNVAGAVRPNTRLIYIESPSNPLIHIVDIAAVAAIAREQGCLLFIDSTFASPAVQNPLALGASLVLHSATKYLGGHSDIMAGAVAGGRELVRKIRDAQVILGNLMDPHAAWLLLRSIRTLGLRVERQSANALEIARFLEKQGGIKRVYYPGLESAPGFEVARKQMKSGGAMMSFEVEGGIEGARKFCDSLELIHVATSLGGIETLVEIPWELDFSGDELGDAAGDTGIAPELIRLSVGTEEIGDLLADLAKGVEALGAVRTLSTSSR